MTEKYFPTMVSPTTEADRRAWRRAALLADVYAPLMVVDGWLTGDDLWAGAKVFGMIRTCEPWR